MPRKVYEEISRGIWPFSCKYMVYPDRIKIQSPLRVYWFDIPFDDIEKVEIRNPPVKRYTAGDIPRKSPFFFFNKWLTM